MMKTIQLHEWLLKDCYILLSLIFLIGMSGCSSIGKGVAEAILEKSEEEDTRVCQIWGKPFDGLESGLMNKHGTTRVLMVHGVGDHLPGYATEFLEKLTRELKLDARSGSYKDIALSAPLMNYDGSLGNLRVSHLSNENGDRELIFYELTWSDITRDEKALLAFDNSGEYSFRRAQINGMLKTFGNDTGPDPIIYLGKSRELILAAFGQSFCWMATRDWNDLPESGKHACPGLTNATADHLNRDDYVFVSHSLGSRIAIDGLERVATILANPKAFIHQNEKVVHDPDSQKFVLRDGREIDFSNRAIDALRNKRIKIFMLSNQLPMLQLGRDLPEVSGQGSSYCTPGAPNYKERTLSETSIIAFSDPNDLLSYAIPPGFSDKYLDSRLCPKITNININIAKVMDAFGISNLANPLEAHVGYDRDDRVVALIARGIGNEKTASLIKEKCEWTKIMDE